MRAQGTASRRCPTACLALPTASPWQALVAGLSIANRHHALLDAYVSQMCKNQKMPIKMAIPARSGRTRRSP